MKRFKYPPFMTLVGLMLQGFLSIYLPIFTFNHIPIFFSITLIFFGIGSIFYLLNIFKQNKTAIQPDGEPERLLTQGIYNYSRNPIYLSMTIILTGSAMLHHSLSSYFIPLIFILLVKNIWIDYEEHKLKKIFGQEYLDYKNEVRRWI